MVALITGARARLPCSQPWLSSCVTGMDHWSLITSPSLSSPLLSFLLPSYLLAAFLPFSFPAPHPRPISVLTSAYSVVQICLKIGAILCARLPIVCIRGICLHAQGTYFSKIRLLHTCNGIKDTFSTAVLGWICEKMDPWGLMHIPFEHCMGTRWFWNSMRVYICYRQLCLATFTGARYVRTIVCFCFFPPISVSFLFPLLSSLLFVADQA